MKARRILIIFATVSSVFAEFSPYHLSDEFIEEINSKQSTWKAGRNFDSKDWMRVKAIASGALRNRGNFKHKMLTHKEDVEVPEEFDAREKWSNCKSLRMIRDQSACGSCWAFAAVAAMSDRICIHSGGRSQTLVSAEDLVTCCGRVCGDGCHGGYDAAAWAYWYTNGIVSGGLYNHTEQGCKAYSMPPCEHHATGDRPQCNDFNGGATFDTPKCHRQCDAGYQGSYNDSLTFGQQPYSLAALPKQIQLEIMKNGPVEASFDVFSDFLNYKSGVYQHSVNESVGGHAVKIVGWGVENQLPYWLIANSWNTDWGDHGYFKIIRGVNECGIESDISAGLPEL